MTSKCKSSKWQKFIAVSIVALLSTGFGLLMRLPSSRAHEHLIERKNLRGIIAEIEKANIDTHALSRVLREPPPLLFIFVATLISTAITVWFYHRILRFVCKRNGQNDL
jgi:uncharacterized membrane protein AbrB (regulator of aidB expression)